MYNRQLYMEAEIEEYSGASMIAIFLNMDRVDER